MFIIYQIKRQACVCFFVLICISGGFPADRAADGDKEKRDNIIKLFKLKGVDKANKQILSGPDSIFTEKDLQELNEKRISLYIKYYTGEEILEMLKLFENPVWKKFQDNEVLMLKEMSEFSSEWAKKVLERAKTDGTIERLKADPNLNYGKMMKLSYEGATRGNLAAIRSAITIYYSEKEGTWPRDITSGFEKYLSPLPPEKITGSNRVVNEFDGKGGWYYINDPKNAKCGCIFVNIEGKDSKGKEYKDY